MSLSFWDGKFSGAKLLVSESKEIICAHLIHTTSYCTCWDLCFFFACVRHLISVFSPKSSFLGSDSLISLLGFVSGDLLLLYNKSPLKQPFGRRFLELFPSNSLYCTPCFFGNGETMTFCWKMEIFPTENAPRKIAKKVRFMYTNQKNKCWVV